MKPDFLIIGAQKCATSWLHHHLRQHPDLFLPEDKDFEFFSYVGNLNKTAFQQWSERFAGAGAARVGDANAAYFWTNTGHLAGGKPGSFNPAIPDSICEFLGPDLQLIISLRNPAERAVSAYLHHIVHGAITPEERIEDITAPLGILDMGLYGAHLENWLRLYSPQQFLLINGLPKGQQAGNHCLNEVTSFLGVAAFPATHAVETPVFPGVPRLFLEDGIWVAAEHPVIAPHLPLKRIVPMESTADGSYVRLIERAELDRLREFYRPDQQNLADLLTRNQVRVVVPGASLGLGSES